MSEPNWTPKVHPLDRGVEPDDPMELMANPAPGDPDVMFDCIVQEFAWMGWDADQLFRLFRDPGYPVLNQLGELFGDDEVRRRLDRLVTGPGVFRVREVFDEALEPEEPELIQLGVRSCID